MMRTNITILFMALLMTISTFAVVIPAPNESMPTRADPTLSNGGVTTTSADPLTGNFTFFVTYIDADNDAPWNSVGVCVDGFYYTMGTTDTVYSSGANFTRTMNGYESGSHYYYFSTDKHFWNGTIHLPENPWEGNYTFWVDGNYSTPDLTDGAHNPNRPGVGQDINFTVIYRDGNGHSPKYVQIQLDSGTWTNMTIIGTDYMNGSTCYHVGKFTNYGSHTYKFRTMDTTNLSKTRGPYYLYVENAAPELYDAGVTPATGDADKTNFTFYVHYKDWEGDAPNYVRLYLYEKKGPEEWNYTSNTTYMFAGDGPYNSTHYKNGVNFTVTMQLLTADYDYRFKARGSSSIYYPDTEPFFILNTTGWRHRPEIYGASFSPMEGTENTLFNISVYYKDLDNNPPEIIKFRFEGTEYNMNVHGSDHRNGTLCSLVTKLPFGMDRLYFIAQDEQGLWSGEVWTNDSLKVKGTGELGFLSNAYVTPNPGEQSTYRYEFFVDYIHPVDGNRSMYAREMYVHINNGTYNMWDNWYSGNNSIQYYGRVYGLEPGTYSWHIEGLDYGFRDMRYPESGEMTLEVFEEAPNIGYGYVYPSSGNDQQKFSFNMTIYEEWEGDNSSGKDVSAYVVIDGIKHSMTELGSPPNYSYETNFYFKTYLKAGDHQYHFRAEYEDGAYDVYPDHVEHFTIFVDGHNELLGRRVHPLSPSTDDVMNFTIVYKDTGGIEADYVRIFIDNEVYNMSETAENVTLGKTYYFRLKLSEGNHTFWFEAMGRNGTLRSPEIGNYYKVYVKEPSIVNYPILRNATISPTSGDNTTSFTFRVTYLHLDGSSPGNISVVVDGTTHAMSATGTINYTSGVVYVYTTKLTVGEHLYFFEANDSSGLDIRMPLSDGYRITVSSGSSGGSDHPPVAMISYTVNGMNVSLDGTDSYDVGGSIVLYYWVVDGSSMQGSTQTVSFTDPGFYSATLTVIDDDGMSAVASVRFWVIGSSGSSSPDNEVGGYIEVSSGGQGSIMVSEDGTSIILDEVDEHGASFSFDSNSTDPKVIILEVSKQALEISSGEDIKLQIDGEDIELVDSIDDLLDADGDSPMYYIVRTGDSFKVMLYLPDPSQVDDIDIVVIDNSMDDKDGSKDSSDRLFLWLMIGVIIILAILVIVLLLARKGPKYEGVPEFDDDDYDEEMDFDLVKGSRRETYRHFLEE